MKKKITSQKKKSNLKKKADKMLQEYGRSKYKSCEVCGREYTCLHHYYPKSVSFALRYNLDNCVAICNGCHCRHHQANDPSIHDRVREKRGQDWLDKLTREKGVYTPDTIKHIEEVITNIQALKDNYV